MAGRRTNTQFYLAEVIALMRIQYVLRVPSFRNKVKSVQQSTSSKFKGFAFSTYTSIYLEAGYGSLHVDFNITKI